MSAGMQSAVTKVKAESGDREMRLEQFLSAQLGITGDKPATETSGYVINCHTYVDIALIVHITFEEETIGYAHRFQLSISVILSISERTPM